MLAEIFAYLAPSTPDKPCEHDDTERREALLACAVSSKALSQHALDVLWRVLEDVTPLFRLLPFRQSDESEWVSST